MTSTYTLDDLPPGVALYSDLDDHRLGFSLDGEIQGDGIRQHRIDDLITDLRDPRS